MKTQLMNKKNLQILMSLLALIPLLTGLIGLTGIHDPIYGSLAAEGMSEAENSAEWILLDSNLRFFSGVWIGVGIALLSVIRHIEKEQRLFQLIWLCVFIGGIGRVLSMFFMGLPLTPFIGFTLLEIVGAPFFIYWQRKIATPNTTT